MAALDLASDREYDVDVPDHRKSSAEGSAPGDDSHGDAKIVAHPHNPTDIGAAVEPSLRHPCLEEPSYFDRLAFRDASGAFQRSRIGRNRVGTIIPPQEPARYDHGRQGRKNLLRQGSYESRRHTIEVGAAIHTDTKHPHRDDHVLGG